MANDPRDANGVRLQSAVQLLGRHTGLRQELINWLKQAETRLNYPGSVRDDISGPIIDALHTEDDLYNKTLADGTRFEFLYRTKIARDFMLADQERPSHVWEPQTTRLLKHLTAGCQTDVLIGGAYFGDHAIVLGCQLRGSGRLVHCFEPNATQADMLRKNGDINDLKNLYINKIGLWNKSSQRLRLDGFDSFANAVPAKSDEEGFETVTIDDYCTAQQRQLGVLMLDIEGAELSALMGAAHVIAHNRPSIVFEVHRDYVDWTAGLMQTPICSLLGAAGYKLFAVRDFNTHQEMGERCIELIPADDVYIDGPPHGFNMLAVTDIALVTGPIFRMVSHVSPKLLRHKGPELHHPIDGLPL